MATLQSDKTKKKKNGMSLIKIENHPCEKRLNFCRNIYSGFLLSENYMTHQDVRVETGDKERVKMKGRKRREEREKGKDMPSRRRYRNEM